MSSHPVLAYLIAHDNARHLDRQGVAPSLALRLLVLGPAALFVGFIVIAAGYVVVSFALWKAGIG
ncbi:MAG: hypothetical protein ACRYGM_05255 [Janthinobacterium lividum]